MRRVLLAQTSGRVSRRSARITSASREIEMNKTLNAGSAEAVALDCECPRLDNGHGRGYLGNPNVFVYSENCPVHCKHDKPGATSPAQAKGK